MKILKHGVIYRFICAACPMCGCLAEEKKELLAVFGEKHENDDSEPDLR